MEDQRNTGWSEKVVSWGHMLIALAVLFGSFTTYTISNERANEKRLATLEERYLQLAEINRKQDETMAQMLQARNAQISNIEKKLDTIAADLFTLKLQLATKIRL